MALNPRHRHSTASATHDAVVLAVDIRIARWRRELTVSKTRSTSIKTILVQSLERLSASHI